MTHINERPEDQDDDLSDATPDDAEDGSEDSGLDAADGDEQGADDPQSSPPPSGGTAQNPVSPNRSANIGHNSLNKGGR